MTEYYNYKQILSRQASMNMIVGNRGCGKTYGFLKHVVNRHITHGKEFMYIRRFSTEVDKCKKNLFDTHLKNQEFGEHIISFNNGVYKRDGQTMGYILPLTRAPAIKSTAYPNVETIIYDEFLITSRVQHYLRNEPFEFASLCDSVFRDRDPHIYMLGNASSITNPYFDYFDIKLDPKQEYQRFKNGLILVHYVKNSTFREQRKLTKFGRLMSGTSYEDYAFDNKFCFDNATFIAKRPKNSWLWACLYIDTYNYGLWISREDNKMYVSHAYDPNNPRFFALTNLDHNENMVLVNSKRSPWVKLMIERYKQGLLFFENQSIKNHMMKFIELNL